jgi:hypothetical protein
VGIHRLKRWAFLPVSHRGIIPALGIHTPLPRHGGGNHETSPVHPGPACLVGRQDIGTVADLSQNRFLLPPQLQGPSRSKTVHTDGAVVSSPMRPGVQPARGESTMSRIDTFNALKAQRRKALIPFVTAGFRSWHRARSHARHGGD